MPPIHNLRVGWQPVDSAPEGYVEYFRTCLAQHEKDIQVFRDPATDLTLVVLNPNTCSPLMDYTRRMSGQEATANPLLRYLLEYPSDHGSMLIMFGSAR